jgi:hypothetical protein
MHGVFTRACTLLELSRPKLRAHGEDRVGCDGGADRLLLAGIGCNSSCSIHRSSNVYRCHAIAPNCIALMLTALHRTRKRAHNPLIMLSITDRGVEKLCAALATFPTI